MYVTLPFDESVDANTPSSFVLFFSVAGEVMMGSSCVGFELTDAIVVNSAGDCVASCTEFGFSTGNIASH